MSAARSLYPLAGKRVWVAGHRGMVGSALLRRLRREACEILTVDREKVDLRRQQAVEEWISEARPQAIFLSAAKVGGILANDTKPADFLYDNLLIAANVIQAAAANGVEKLLYLGSSCIYPKFAPQPIKEDALLSGKSGAHQRVVRHRQNRRAQTLPSVSATVWLRFHLGDADEPLRAGR